MKLILPIKSNFDLVCLLKNVTLFDESKQLQEKSWTHAIRKLHLSHAHAPKGQGRVVSCSHLHAPAASLNLTQSQRSHEGTPTKALTARDQPINRCADRTRTQRTGFALFWIGRRSACNIVPQSAPTTERRTRTTQSRWSNLLDGLYERKLNGRVERESRFFHIPTSFQSRANQTKVVAVAWAGNPPPPACLPAHASIYTCRRAA